MGLRVTVDRGKKEQEKVHHDVDSSWSSRRCGDKNHGEKRKKAQISLTLSPPHLRHALGHARIAGAARKLLELQLDGRDFRRGAAGEGGWGWESENISANNKATKTKQIAP